MNSIRCPQCNLINQTSALQCQQCGFPFSNLPPTAYVSVPATEYEKTVSFSAPLPPMSAAAAIPADNEIGRKTYFWYRLYCVLMALLYLCVFGMGVALTIMAAQMSSQMRSNDPPMAILGVVYAIVGLVFTVPFVIAIFLPRQPRNWMVGIVLIALGMTSICFLPFLIPLLIFWVKPETQAFFGRRQ